MKKNIQSALLFVAIIAVFSTCGQRPQAADNNQAQTVTESSIVADNQPVFSHVEIPEELTELEEQAAFLVTHYWDNFDFSDVELIRTSHIVEQAFVNYLSILPHTTREIADASIVAMLTKAIEEDPTGEMYAYFLNLYAMYLYDPNSPIRNEEFYITVTEFIISHPASDEMTRIRAEFDLSMMLKNRMGTVATDFRYITIGGTRGSLHQLNRDFTIIYFHNPGCPACEEAKRQVRSSQIINHLLNVGRLDILAVYTDEDLDLWYQHQQQIPSFWINARDEPRIIRSRILYDLRAVPSFYLLDRDKIVLLKDADVRTIELYLIGLEEARRRG